MKVVEKLGLLLIFVLVGIGVYLSHNDLAAFESFYVKEDGVVEWATVLALFGCAFACFYRASILRPFRKTPFVVSLVLMGFIFLFGIGEEISWGQRIFNFKSPDFFMINNSQMEFNIHNLIVGGIKINKLFFGTLLGMIVGFYFLVLPLLYRKHEPTQRIADALAIPVPKWWHIFMYVILFVLVKYIPSGKRGEILEFGGTWIFLFMLLEPYNRIVFSRRSLER